MITSQARQRASPRSASSFPVALALLALLFAACGSSDPNAGTGTWAVDCVAVVGAPPAAALTPLDAVSLSGLPRNKYIGELSDAEVGRLCDWSLCVSGNGYRYYVEQSRVEAPSIMSEIVWTARRTPPHFIPGSRRIINWDSRESCMDVYRREQSRCHVGPFEDCFREQAVLPLAYYRTPSCYPSEGECGF